MPDFFVAPADWGINNGMGAGVYSTYTGGVPALQGGYIYWGPAQTGSSAPGAAATAASTGVAPTETQYALYGHIVPLLVFGRGRVGGDIIVGPWQESGLVSGINSFGVQADPTRILTLVEIALDSEVVWQGSCVGSASGPVTPSSGGFSITPFPVRFYTGSLTQSADPLETSHWGADAVAYRGQVLLAIENLPLANTKFKKYPYISARFVDQDGQAINFGDAFERLAYSPYVGLTSAQFETNCITYGVPDGGFIIAQDTEFLQLIQQFQRFYPNWDIVQTDKLRIIDRGPVAFADLNLDATRLTGAVTVTRQGDDSVKRDLELSTIDPDADYTIVPSIAKRPSDPVTVTTSVGKDAAYLPMIMDASTRMSIVTFARYHEEVTRKTISGTAMAYGLQIEPGTLLAIRNLGDDFTNETFRVRETLHGIDYTVEFTAESMLACAIPNADPYLQYVVLLMSFNGSNGSVGAPAMNDESPHLWGTAQYGSANGMGNGAVASSTQSQFGATSLSLDGSSAIRFLGLQPSELAYMTFGANPFTVEMFIYPNSVTGTQFLVGRWDGFILGSLSWVVYLSGTNLVLNLSTTGSDNLSIVSGGTVVLHAWQHVAIDYDGTKYRAYINGFCVASTTATHTIFNPGAVAPQLAIGANTDNSGFRYTGFIDELRLTNGVARYATNGSFTVPASPFPRTS